MDASSTPSLQAFIVSLLEPNPELIICLMYSSQCMILVVQSSRPQAFKGSRTMRTISVEQKSRLHLGELFVKIYSSGTWWAPFNKACRLASCIQ